MNTKKKNLSPQDLLMNKPYLSEEDIMLIFNISKSSVRRWRKNHVIPFIKLGGIYFSPKHMLKEYLDSLGEDYFQKYFMVSAKNRG